MRRYMIIGLAVAGVSVASSSFAQSAPPPPPPPSYSGGGSTIGGGSQFGFARQLTISSDAQLSLLATSGGGSTVADINIKPAVDYFVIDHLSIGGFLQIADINSATTFGIGPRVGYNIPIVDQVSVWLKGGFSFENISVNGASNSNFALNFFVPFLVHLAPHFFVGFGPELDVGLTSPSTVTYGLNLTVGGWLGL